MPRVDIPVTQLNRTGVAPPAQINGDLTNKHQFPNNGATIIEVVSSDAGAQTVTVETPGSVDGLAVADQVISVPAGATRFIGPFPTTIYNQSDGMLYVNPSVSTTLKFRVYSM